jgi:hypothetical protein
MYLAVASRWSLSLSAVARWLALTPALPALDVSSYPPTRVSPSSVEHRPREILVPVQVHDHALAPAEAEDARHGVGGDEVVDVYSPTHTRQYTA